jgi:hypothetical protein
VRHSGAIYDLIQMTGVDTLAALSTGAYVLAENYLYTVDAVSEFLDHLSPKGLLSVAFADYSLAIGFPRHTMRQLSLFIAALERRGIENPEQHIAVLASAEDVPQVSMLLRQTPFTPEEVERLRRFAEQMQFRPWVLPGQPLSSPHSRYVRATKQGRVRLLASYPLILTPTSDDNPFFFNFYRWRHLLDNLDEVDVGHTMATGQIILGLILLFSVLLSAGYPAPCSSSSGRACGRRASGATWPSSPESASASSSSRSASSRSSSCSWATPPTPSRWCCSRSSPGPGSGPTSRGACAARRRTGSRPSSPGWRR